MYNRRYDKKFLMLRQEVVGYSMGQKTPWGTCTIEIKNGKGTMHVHVQGLRNVAKQIYDVYMIGGQERSIFCNTLQLDAKGQGDFTYAFSPDGIGAYGVAIEDIHTIAVVVDDERTHHIVAPLVAYADQKTEWKMYFQKTKPSKIQKVFSENEFPPPSMPNYKQADEKSVSEMTHHKQQPTAVNPRKTTSPEIGDDCKVLLSFPVDKTLKTPYSTKRIANISTETELSTPKRIALSQSTDAKATPISDIKVAESVDISTPQPFAMMPWERKVFQEESPDTYHSSFRGLIEKFRKELNQLENDGVFTENDMESIRKAGANVDKPVDSNGFDVDTVDKNVGISVDNSNLPVDKPVDTVDKYLDTLESPKRFSTKKGNSLFHNHLKVQPFSTTPEAVWTCITLDELLYIKEIPIAWQRDLFFLYPMKKFGHLLYKEEYGQQLIGVPIEKKDHSFFQNDAISHAFHDFLEVDTGDIGYFVRCIADTDDC